MSPITREDHPCWLLACDFCGEGDNAEYGGSFHYGTQDEARRALLDVDWRELEDGRLQCLPCSEMANACPDDT